MKNNISNLIIAVSIFSIMNIALAEEKIKSVVPARGGTELTEAELSARIGRMGDAEKVPEDFEFNKAEIKLWHENHLENIQQPLSLYYEFEQSGSEADGFTDSVSLSVIALNGNGTKNVHLDFFTAENRQYVSPDNVTEITGNPVIGIYMFGDVQLMERLTSGHWRHFQKSIKISLRKDAVVEPTTFNFNGKNYQGEKVYFSPYLNDPHRRDFERFAEKYYELIFSDEIPGSLYRIRTVVSDKSKEGAEPLILETLTLVDVKANKS